MDKSSLAKCLSPLRKIPVTRFSFTTPWKGGEDKSGASSLQKLVTSLGLSAPPKNLEHNSVVNAAGDSESGHKLEAVKALPPSPKVVVRFQSKLTQTDIFKCEKCEKRKTIIYKQQEVQCGVGTVECGTQITEEDMSRFGIRFDVGYSKRSLAQLTPAQLLGKEDNRRRERYSPIGVAEPMNISSENYPMRRGPLNQHLPKLPSLIDQLESSMKYSNARQSFGMRETNTVGFNRNLEFQERPSQFIQPAMFEGNTPMQRIDDDLYIQSQFEPPPPQRDDFYFQGRGGRRFF